MGGQPRAWSARVSLACVADELTHGVLGFSLPATQAKYSGMAVAIMDSMFDLLRKILNEFFIIWLHPANLNE